MKCVTGKVCYEEEEIAKEALISSHVRNAHRPGSGPINIYECDDCEQWHLTSKGATANFLLDAGVKARIEKEKRLRKWSEGF